MFSRRSQPLADPFAAVWLGEYERAVALLHHDTRPGAAFTRARVYAHLRLTQRVVADYEAGADGTLGQTEAILYRSVVAWALQRHHDRDGALALVAQAERDAAGLRDPLLRATVAYYRAFVEYGAGDEVAAERTVEATLSLVETLGDSEPREPYRFERNHLRARLFEIVGNIRGARGDYAGRERALIDAVLCAELVRNRDYVHEANLLASLSALLTEFPAVRARELVFVKALRLSWNAHIDRHRATIKAALAGNRTIFGNSIDAEALGGRSAPALSYRLSRCVGSLTYDAWPTSESYADELQFAVSIARASDWSEAADDGADRLLELAALVAPHDVAVARELFENSERASRAYSPFLVTCHDPRRSAIDAFARGCIAKAEGDSATALAGLNAANAFWRERGLLVRAAFGGIEAFALSRDDADLSAARAFVATYAQTAFARRLRAALAASDASTPRPFPYLGDGRLTPAIAE